MNNTETKAALTAIFMTLTKFLGWRGKLILAWIACMMLDYASGYAKAKVKGEWESRIAREGILHKGGMILVVMLGFLADLVITTACEQLPGLGINWPVLVAPSVLLWCILTEIGSCLENAAEMGAPVPAWMVQGIKKTQAAMEAKAEQEKISV